jgi:RNA polymerase sigma factor (sigma-70 family)
MATTNPPIEDDLVSVYLRQWNALRSRLSRRTGSREIAEEALQETWLKLARLSDEAAIHDRQAFILRVASNIAIDLLRREHRHSSRCVSDESLLDAVIDAYPDPEAVAIDRDNLRRLVEALAILPVKPRTALLMSRCDGLRHCDIAERLGVSESMVARYLAQALRHCRDHLRDFA